MKQKQLKLLLQLSDIAQHFSNCSMLSFKNKILLQKAILSSKEAAILVKRVISLLNSADREHLSRLVDDHADEKGNLYIRLDKQRICQGRVSLSETDAIRIRFRPIRRFKPSDTVQNYMNLFQSKYAE